VPDPGRLERFFKYVDQTDTCWLWRGGSRVTTPAGEKYGDFYWGPPRIHIQAHRAAYELLVGPIPAGLTLDHLCRTTLCVNPEHLEPVTMRENALRGKGPTAVNARKTHCKRGHEFTPENTYVYPRGGRECRTCSNFYKQAYVQRKREVEA
jgi:hypothetical protein